MTSIALALTLVHNLILQYHGHLYHTNLHSLHFRVKILKARYISYTHHALSAQKVL